MRNVACSVYGVGSLMWLIRLRRVWVFDPMGWGRGKREENGAG